MAAMESKRGREVRNSLGTASSSWTCASIRPRRTVLPPTPSPGSGSGQRPEGRVRPDILALMHGNTSRRTFLGWHAPPWRAARIL